MIFISQCYGQLSSAVDSMNISYDLKVKQIYNFKKAKGYSRWMLQAFNRKQLDHR